MPSIKISSVPIQSTIHDYIKFQVKTEATPRQQYSNFLKFALPEDLNFLKLVEDTQKAIETYGEWNYRLPGPGHFDKSYGGIGLTYNPDHVDGDTANIHEQVQGNHNPGTTGVWNPFSMHGQANMPKIKRNTHYDSYGFVHRTPASHYGELGRFLDTFKRNMVRTAVRIIYAENEGPVGDDKYAGVAWHIDEPMPVNLRVNIPLVTHPDYVLEQKDVPPVHLEAGYAYTWNTNLLHRAYATTRTAPPRIHLMLGFSCWWDFDHKTQTWTSNEFAGKKHPIDMLVDGDVIPGIKLLD